MKMLRPIALLLALAITAVAAPAPAAPAIRIGLPHIVVPPPPSSGWLAYLNRLRELGGLPHVTERADLSNGAYLHARYMVKNDTIGHSEDASLPFYSPAGATAAARSNVMVSSSVGTGDTDALDLWALGPFHGVGLIDPQLIQVGFGSYREAGGRWAMGAVLDVLSSRAPRAPAGVSLPIGWPGAGVSSWLTTYTGNEYPDPLSSCPGYSAPSGAPIYLLAESAPLVSSSLLSRGGVALDHCVYTGATYANAADPAAQSLGRNVLSNRKAVVMIPRQPLVPGIYTVSFTVNGAPVTWSFSVTDIAPAAAEPAQHAIDMPPAP
jgi:hypothetical protein